MSYYKHHIFFCLNERKNGEASCAQHDAQGGLCAICDQPETATRDGKVKWLAVDHDHVTGELRDLLCQRCNVMIGHCADNPEVLRAAAAYLERHARLSEEAA